MNLSEEKQQLYARLHDWMYQESIRTRRTPMPEELKVPGEWDAFVEWRHQNWLRLCDEAAKEFRVWLDKKEGKSAALALAETPPPYPSKI